MEKLRFLTKRRLCYAISIIVPIFLIFHQLIGVYKSSPFNPAALSEQFIRSVVVSIAAYNESSSPSSSSSPPVKYPCTSSNDLSSNMVTPKDQEEHVKKLNKCDYSYGKWIPSDLEPLYNDTTGCRIKDEQKCLSNGRPDSGYLYWRWKPSGDDCELPRFDPEEFLTLMKDKHLAFVGDSMARNQAESLICMLSSFYHPLLVYSHHGGGQVHEYARWTRWHFPSHNVNISIYWSPYLVKGTVIDPHMIYVDKIDETWTSDLGLFNVLVLSIGHWFHWPFVIFEGGLVLGCHGCYDPNQTEIDTGVAISKAFRIAVRAIVDEQRKASHDHMAGNGIDVIVTTYSGDHFEGGTRFDMGHCPRTEPYEESTSVEPMFERMRKIELEAVEEARSTIMSMGHEVRVRIMALDVTRLSWLRPDAHAGLYMHPFPISNRTDQPTLVRKDCLHWCLPGAIDTWNEIMLQVIKDWQMGSA